MDSYLTIGQFAEIAGVSARALRLYETHGLVKSDVRGDNGYRYYSEKQLESIERIKKLKALGFSLREIRAMVLGDLPLDPAPIREFIQQKISTISQAQEELAVQKRQLQSVLASLEAEQEISTDSKRFLMKFFETELPFISVRGIVFFPGNTHTLYIGRTFSIAAIEESIKKHGGRVVVAAQKVYEMNDKPDPDQIFEIGCLCQIRSHQKELDGTLKVTLEATTRWHIIDLKDVDGIRICEGAELPYSLEKELPTKTKNGVTSTLLKNHGVSLDAPLTSELQNAPDPFAFANQVGGKLHSLLNLKEQADKKGSGPNPFFIDTLPPEDLERINVDLARIQEVLAEDDPEHACLKLQYLLSR